MDLDREPVPTVIVGVRVFDVDTATVGNPVDVILQDGRIASMIPHGSPLPMGLETVDGTGATLLPGLVDCHVHLGAAFGIPGHLPIPAPKENLRDFLAAGVTSVLDLATPIDDLQRFRKRIDGGWAGPAIYGSGRPFTAPDGHPWSSIRAMYPSLLVRMATRDLAWGVTSPADVDHAIAAEGPRDVIKVVLDQVPVGGPEIGTEQLDRLALAADALGVPLVAHVGRTSDLQLALDHGADALAHAPYVGRISDEQLGSLARGGIAVIPTLAVWQAVESADAQQIRMDPFSSSLLSKKQLRWTEAPAPMPEPLHEWAQQAKAGHDDRAENVRGMLAAGVDVLVGSDGPFLGMAAGGGTHQEIHALIDAGMSPGAALVAATDRGASLLDPDGKFGAVRVGWEADLLLVDGDPVADPAALERIRAVWTDGRQLRQVSTAGEH